MHGVDFSLAELARHIGGEISGDGALRIRGVASLERAGDGELSFYSNKKYRKALDASKASAFIVGSDDVLANRTIIRVENPYLGFAKVSALFSPPRRSKAGRSPDAFIHPTAEVDPSVEIMAYVYVDAGAKVGPGTTLYPGVFIGEGSRVGRDCVLYPHVVIREGCTVGDRVIMQPGAVVGSDGFGFAFDPQGDGNGPRHFKIPQAGTVVIEDDVELGSCTCVDRATLGVTLVSRGAKIDNLVQIAHNVQVGSLSLLAAQVGVAGSTKLGVGVVCGGQVGITNHLNIGDGVQAGAKSGLMQDIEAGAVVSGSPAHSHRDWRRNSVAFTKLGELVHEVRRLEREVEALKAGKKVGER